jgi:tetrahydromethanopterin S-methyltransferase subunit G
VRVGVDVGVTVGVLVGVFVGVLVLAEQLVACHVVQSGEVQSQVQHVH